MRIHLIRHGQTVANVEKLIDTALPGLALTQTGEEQAAALPAAMTDIPLAAIVASGAIRTLATAAPLAATRSLQIQRDADFREIGAGDLELSASNEDWQTYIDTVTTWWTGDLSAANPGAEDGFAFFARWDNAIARCGQLGDVAVITHGGAMRTWCFARCPNINLALAREPMPNTGRVVVEGEPGDWRVVSWLGKQLDPAPVARTAGGPGFAATDEP